MGGHYSKEQWRDYNQRRKAWRKAYAKKWRFDHHEEYNTYMRNYKRKQRGIPLNKALDTRKIRGTKFEKIAANILNASWIGGKIDLLWQGKTVEVKANTIRKDNVWSFGRNKDKSDWYMYFCLDKNYNTERIYLIPSKCFVKSVSLSTKSSRWETYRMVAPKNLESKK